ncbi:MAG: NAD(P)/FAD-dependent oxidoreductase [Deltaproteobacteria bacterium]|nr:NAD(P)/FAD-dependent oxidoreductase [Deltaproteobacteria bacterium]
MVYKSIEDVRDRYDVVVIGSGLGGLTSANRLARADHKVLLLEHHHQIGGLATWFKRRGHIFDISLHGFPYGMVKTCRKYWNREIMDSIVQLKNIRFDNPQFSITTTFDRQDFSSILHKKFKVERQVIADFFTTVAGMNFYDDRSMTTRELFERFFPGRSDIHRLLMEPITYANGSSLDDPAITYGIVFSNFMNKGVFTFTGGTDKLIGMMVAEAEKNGVTFCTGARVDKVIIDKGRVQGVLAAGRTIVAPAVVSNGGILNTVNDLAGREAFPDDFLRECDTVKVNNSSCQVYMGIKEGEKIDDIGDLIFTSESAEFSSDEMLDMETRSRTFSLYYPKTRPDHKRYTIVASMNANYDDWVGLDPLAYKQAKDKMIQRTLTALEKYLPGVREKCDWLEAATPKTFQRYTLHSKGSSFGTKFEGLDVSRSIFKVVPGLFHVGSVGIIMSGWLGAINYGVIVANDVDAHLR